MAEVNDDGVDLEKVNEYIADVAKHAVTEHMQQFTAPQSQQQPQQQLTQEDAARRNLEQILAPFIEPRIRQLQTQSAAGIDRIDFYTNNVDAKEYQDEIEKVFNDQLAQGRGIPRADIYRYLQGKKLEEDPKGFMERMTERQKRQVERVSSGADLGFAALDRAKNDSNFSKERLWAMPMDELTQLMDGLTF